MKIFRRKRDAQSIIDIIHKKNRIQRWSQFLLGIFLLSIAFNVFFLPQQVVYGGVSGISIITEKLFNLDPSIFILLSSMLLIAASFIFLGKKETYRTIIGSLMYPIFIKLTIPLAELIDLAELDLLMGVLFGGLLAGFGGGLIFKSGFTTGGTDIINQIVSKYFKVSLGKSMIMTDGLIVLAGAFVFGIENTLYAVIALYIISFITDRVILGISGSKAFYIMTSKVNDVQGYILENLSQGMTILEAEGGYSGKKEKMLMCVIPTKDYFRFKEGVKIIDPEAFFVVTDAYQVRGGAYK